MKARSRVKVGNRQNNPAYRTPSTFIGKQSLKLAKNVKIRKKGK